MYLLLGCVGLTGNGCLTFSKLQFESDSFLRVSSVCTIWVSLSLAECLVQAECLQKSAWPILKTIYVTEVFVLCRFFCSFLIYF